MKNRLLVALLAGACALPAAHAADYALAEGAVHFFAPDAWTPIMEKLDGDPQFIAFQVRDPSPAGAKSLARITVTVRHEPDLSSFSQYVESASAAARKLQGYNAQGGQPTSSGLRYTAMENGTRNAYLEHYAYRGVVAVQVRCIRPDKGVAAQWMSSFDAGCQSIIDATSH